MYGTGGASIKTFAACTAFLEIDVGEIVFEVDGFERTGAHTFSAPDASISAYFTGYSAFVARRAGDPDASVALPFVAKFEQVPWAGGDTFSA